MSDTFIYSHFIYCRTSRWSLKQEGLYVTSRSIKHTFSTYSLRKLACKWSGYGTFWFHFDYRYYMMTMTCYDLFLCIYISRCYWQVFLNVQDTWHVMDVNGIDGFPWILDWVREWIVLVWVFNLCTCDIWSIIVWLCI